MPKQSSLRDIRPQDIRADAHADGHEVILTDDLLRVMAGDSVRLDVRIEDIRRIQFDIERDRPATMVIVPDAPSSEPQVMMVHPNEIETVARVLGVIGIRMAERGR